jgi:transcriptional regulator with XRE-family HTH domain
MLGDKIKELRNQNHLTQTELAAKLKITRSALSLYELNKRKPDGDILITIANYFNVTTDFLLGKEQVTKDSITDQQNLLDSLSPENQRKALEYIKMLKIMDEVTNSDDVEQNIK